MKWYLFLIGFCAAAVANELPPQPAFQVSEIPIYWNAPSNALPPTVWSYRCVPHVFSSEVISNLLAIGSFTEKEKKDYGTNGFTCKSADQSRSLWVSFPRGAIEYFGDLKKNHSVTNFSGDVPNEAPTLDLATNVLRKLGISPSDIAKGSNGAPRMLFSVGTAEYYSNNTFITNIESRGVCFVRSIDDVDFLGIGGRGGGEVHFGEHGRILRMLISWRGLERDKQYPTPSVQTLIKQIRNGKAVSSPVTMNGESIDWSMAKSLTISEASPCYAGEQRRFAQDRLFPLIVLTGMVNTGTTNLPIELHCPIVGESAGPK